VTGNWFNYGGKAERTKRRRDRKMAKIKFLGFFAIVGVGFLFLVAPTPAKAAEPIYIGTVQPVT